MNLPNCLIASIFYLINQQNLGILTSCQLHLFSTMWCTYSTAFTTRFRGPSCDVCFTWSRWIFAVLFIVCSLQNIQTNLTNKVDRDPQCQSRFGIKIITFTRFLPAFVVAIKKTRFRYFNLRTEDFINPFDVRRMGKQKSRYKLLSVLCTTVSNINNFALFISFLFDSQCECNCLKSLQFRNENEYRVL